MNTIFRSANRSRARLLFGPSLLCVGILLTAGCSHPSDDTAANAPTGAAGTQQTAVKTANVPPVAAQEGSGAQSMGQSRGQNDAANAAAFKAARAKAEGKR